MKNYEEAGVKLTNNQLRKLKFAAKTKAWTTLRVTNKKFRDTEFYYELYLTTRQKSNL